MRHGLVEYRTARMTTRPRMKPTRGVRNWKSATNESVRGWGLALALAKPRVLVVGPLVLVDGVVSKVIVVAMSVRVATSRGDGSRI